MGMNINFGSLRILRNPYTKEQQEEMKKNIEYAPQELKPEEEKPGNNLTVREDAYPQYLQIRANFLEQQRTDSIREGFNKFS